MLGAVSQVSAKDLNATDDKMAISVEETLFNADESSNSATFSDLNQTINGNDDLDIYLTSDYMFNSSSDSNFTKGIQINRNVTIYGNGHTIDANKQARIFLVSHGGIVFRDLNLINGNVDNNDYPINGGAILDYPNSNFTCINCTFYNNHAVNAGAVEGGTVINCTFKNNHAAYWGGAIYDSYVYNSTFIGNVACYGGALWFCHACENSIFISNQGYLDGGAINTAPIVKCTFIGNYAKNGGAFFMKGFYDIHECIDSIFINNSATYGGALYYNVESSNPNFMAINCDFTNNSAIYGGALYGINSTNSRFNNNSASENGGAMYGENLNASNSIFIGNKALKGGAFSANGDVNSCIFMNNHADEGSAILSQNNDLGYMIDINNSIFLDNDGSYVIDCYDNNIGYCWFGNTALNYTKRPYVKIHTEDKYRKDLNNWLFMNASATPSRINYGEKSTVIFDFYNYDGKIKEMDSSNLDYIYFNLSASNGKLNKKIVLPGETAIFRFTADEDGTVTADAYGVDYSIVISINSTISLSVSDVNINYGEPANLEITLTDLGVPVSGEEVKIKLDGVTYTRTTDSRGKASLAVDLNSGNYTAEVYYKNISTSAKLTVNKLTTQTSISYVKTSDDAVTLIVNVTPSTAEGNVTFNVNGKDYSANVSDSKAHIDLNDLVAGDYVAKAIYGGDINHKSSISGEVKFNVESIIDILAPDVTKYYGGSERFTVILKDNKNNPISNAKVNITINGVSYGRTTGVDGITSIALGLNSGVYNVTTEYAGIKVYSTVIIKSTVISNDFTKMFRNDTQYQGTFVDSQGNLIKNRLVTFNINGVFYNRTTNENGVARMNINLNPGQYVLTAFNPDSGEKHTTVITVLSTIIENHDLTKYYRNDSQYSLRLLDEKGNPVGEGVSIKLNINGVFYTRTSNASGYVKMNINLIPGTYIITAEYNSLMASNRITVLSTLKTNDLSMKYHDGSKFEAEVFDGQGKPYPNQKVSFNINGVFYERFSEDDGVARLSINLMAGRYIITSTFNGLNAANKVTVSS